MAYERKFVYSIISIITVTMLIAFMYVDQDLLALGNIKREYVSASSIEDKKIDKKDNSKKNTGVERKKDKEKSKKRDNKNIKVGYAKDITRGKFRKDMKITKLLALQMFASIENIKLKNKDDVIKYIESNENFLGTLKDSNLDEYLTRAKYAKLVYNIVMANGEKFDLKFTREYSDNFVDLFDAPYKDEIIYLYKCGVIDGKSYDVFSPNDIITRCEAIKVLNRIYGYDKIDYKKAYDKYILSPYDDVDNTDWAFCDIVLATIGNEK